VLIQGGVSKANANCKEVQASYSTLYSTQDPDEGAVIGSWIVWRVKYIRVHVQGLVLCKYSYSTSTACYSIKPAHTALGGLKVSAVYVQLRDITVLRVVQVEATVRVLVRYSGCGLHSTRTRRFEPRSQALPHSGRLSPALPRRVESEAKLAGRHQHGTRPELRLKVAMTVAGCELSLTKQTSQPFPRSRIAAHLAHRDRQARPAASRSTS
jgi:hypothetical protein